MAFEFRLTTQKMNHTIARGRSSLLNSFETFSPFARNQAEMYNRNVFLQWNENNNDIKVSIKVGLYAEHEMDVSNIDMFNHYLCYFPPENYKSAPTVIPSSWYDGIFGQVQTLDRELNESEESKSEEEVEKPKDEKKVEFAEPEKSSKDEKAEEIKAPVKELKAPTPTSEK